MGDATLRLCLAGDVMLGRGVDQVLAHPGDPRIHESWARSALQYVELAEEVSGPIPREVAPEYPWGDLLATIRNPAVDAFVVNLETAVTDRGRPWPGKGIQYRMNPANVGVLTSAGVDVVSLANNHVLDWSEPGLAQTLATLRDTGIRTVGAGENARRAWQPVRLQPEAGGIVVLGVGTPGSGIPSGWAAGTGDPGVALIPDFSKATIRRIRRSVEEVRRPGDLTMLSIHWGCNWGYGVSTARRRFAHRLIEDAGIHLIHGHSSHHPTGIEVHDGSLILYGCGDLITDYQGIGGHEEFRGELGGLYLASFDATGQVTELVIAPTRMDRFRLTRPSDSDRRWLASRLDAACRPLSTSVSHVDGSLTVSW